MLFKTYQTFNLFWSFIKYIFLTLNIAISCSIHLHSEVSRYSTLPPEKKKKRKKKRKREKKKKQGGKKGKKEKRGKKEKKGRKGESSDLAYL